MFDAFPNNLERDNERTITSDRNTDHFSPCTRYILSFGRHPAVHTSAKGSSSSLAVESLVIFPTPGCRMTTARRPASSLVLPRRLLLERHLLVVLWLWLFVIAALTVGCNSAFESSSSTTIARPRQQQQQQQHAFQQRQQSFVRQNALKDHRLSEQAEATPWFPTKIQQTIDYDQTRLYVRQIVVETAEMAQLVMDQYLQYDTQDPFATLATLLSICPYTKQDGGRIGWVEPPKTNTNDAATATTASSSSSLLDGILPASVINDLFEKYQPKAGDIVPIYSPTTQQWHVVQVLEVWTQPIFSSPSSSNQQQQQQQQQYYRVGSFQGSNTLQTRRKLKGSGIMPQIPQHLQTYSIQTAGCQMNVADSERLQGILQYDLQMQVATDATRADLIVLNTCSIRDHAEQKVYDALGPAAARKRQGEALAIVVTGCVAQQEGLQLLKRIPEVDAVLGPQYIPYLATVLQQIPTNQVVATAPIVGGSSATSAAVAADGDWLTPPLRGHDVRAWVTIIQGCNEHCTYCVVPSTRGMEVSRPPEAILQECLELAKQGYKEVTLLGQNIDAYGRDCTPKRTFADLLEFLNTHLPAQMRIRYVTSHPRYFSDRVIDAVANLERVCECFHMPFQAGDDQVLKKMRRGYTYDSYMKIIDKIRAKAPDAAICADVIVGFPGETEEAFQKTLQLMEAVKFDNINSFAYSPRPNTEAALWSDQIDEETKSDRLQRVQKLAAQHGLERSQRYVGRTVEVLIEDANPRKPNQVMGRTRQGRQVYFDGNLQELRGEFVDVLITEASTWSLLGELVGKSQ